MIPLYVSNGLSMLDALRYHGEKTAAAREHRAACWTLQAAVSRDARSTVSYGSANVVTIGSSLIGLEWMLLRMQGPPRCWPDSSERCLIALNRRRSMDSLNQESHDPRMLVLPQRLSADGCVHGQRSRLQSAVPYLDHSAGHLFVPACQHWPYRAVLLLLALSQIIVSALGGPMLRSGRGRLGFCWLATCFCLSGAFACFALESAALPDGSLRTNLARRDDSFADSRTRMLCLPHSQLRSTDPSCSTWLWM